MPNFNSENKKISVVIVNFRSDQYLEKCIASLYNFEKPEELEIILVNNEPEKNLEPILENFSEILLINNSENLGFGKAANLGAQKAQGEILFFLNPDTEMQAPFSMQVKEQFFQEPLLAVIGSKIINEQGKKQKWIFGKKLTFWQLVKNNFWGEKENNEDREREVVWVTGAGMFVKKADFLEAGGFDENFFMYFEDVELCLKIKKQGKKILYFPQIKIKHLENGSVLEYKERKKIYYASQDYYFKKQRGLFEFWLVKIFRKLLK